MEKYDTPREPKIREFQVRRKENRREELRKEIFHSRGREGELMDRFAGVGRP